MTKNFKNTERISEAELNNVNGGALPAVLAAGAKFLWNATLGYVADKAVEKAAPYVKEYGKKCYEQSKKDLEQMKNKLLPPQPGIDVLENQRKLDQMLGRTAF